MDEAPSAAAADAVVACARAGEPDRYLAALLAPPPARPHLLALAAFASELARVPALVRHEPAMGAIRLQWWRDALRASEEGARTGNPVADALRATIEACRLPRAVLIEAIDARELDLARCGLADDAAFAAYLWKSEGALFALAAGILSSGRQQADLRPAAVASGQAYGLARLLIGLPYALARGRVPLPQSRLDAANVSSAELLTGEDSKAKGLVQNLSQEAREALARARKQVANLPRPVRGAFLPLALVETYLRALERPARPILRAPAEVAPLVRVWRIAVAHWLGRI